MGEVITQNEGPSAEALALANLLKTSKDVKNKEATLNGRRVTYFRVERAIRLMLSEVYNKARARNSKLPEIKNRADASKALSLLPRHMLALRVEKQPPAVPGQRGPRTKKPLVSLAIQRDQKFEDKMHYAWLFEGSQWKNILLGVGLVVLLFAAVLFPLWPPFMRQGVWYLSMLALGLVGLLFATAIVRLILFIITFFAIPPGIWLFPNLFEDVGFFDSFKPVWAWEKQKRKKRARADVSGAKADESATNVEKKDVK